MSPTFTVYKHQVKYEIPHAEATSVKDWMGLFRSHWGLLLRMDKPVLPYVLKGSKRLGLLPKVSERAWEQGFES